MTKRVFFVLACAALVSGCFDFVDPDFPEAGAPAVFQASVNADEHGALVVDAQLAPGLQIGGNVRSVRPDTLRINGIAVTSSDVRKNGTRLYTLNTTTTRPQELLLQAPRVEQVTAPAPAVDWFAITKADSDTVSWRRGTELLLHLHTSVGASAPVPQERQWFIDLNGSDRQFRVSSDGLPPDTLRIPSDWVPASANGKIAVNLSFYQTTKLQPPPGDYIGLISYTFQAHWIVRVTEP